MEGQVSKHKEICDKLNEIYRKKNTDYGNSFGTMFSELGIITAITRIGDKYNRLKTLAIKESAEVNDESLKDTLLDMANYCIMTVMEIEQLEAINSVYWVGTLPEIDIQDEKIIALESQ